MKTANLIATLLLLAMSPPTAAQVQREAALFDQTSALRLEIERLDDTTSTVAKQRDQLAGRLNSLATKIKKRKADLPEDSLLPNFGLQGMLQESQQMSESLTLLNKELEALRNIRTQRLQRLGLLYGQLVDQTAQRVRSTSGSQQKELVKVLARVRHQRDLVRRELDPGSAPRPPMEIQNLLATEDPEELSERADAIHDEQDRLRRRLASLDKNISEIRADRRLERDMRDFVEDHTLFSEESRILQVSKSNSAVGGSADHSQEGRQDYDDGSLLDANEAEPGEGALGWGFPGAGESSGDMDGAMDIESRAGQVPVNVDASNSDLGQMNPEKKIQALKLRRRQVVERIKKLQILHDRLREKAESLIND